MNFSKLWKFKNLNKYNNTNISLVDGSVKGIDILNLTDKIFTKKKKLPNESSEDPEEISKFIEMW